MTGRIGLLGGTFDPIHCGHIDVAAAAERALGLARVDFVTAHLPPHRNAPIASAFHRFAMVALAVAPHQGWRASDLELRSPEPSYTAATLAHVHGLGFAPADIVFVIGADAFAEIATWYDYPRVLDAAHFAVVSRPGFPVAAMRDRVPQLAARMTDRADAATDRGTWIFLIDARTADVSATAIRGRLAAGESIAGMVPPGVQQHIERHGLYSTDSSRGEARDAATLPAAGRLHGQD